MNDILSNLNFEDKLGLKPYHLFKYRNEIDRFGFSNYLYQLLKPPYRARAFCHWQHGWHFAWRDINFSEVGSSIYANKYLRSLPSIVYNKRLKHLFEKNSYLDVRLGPLPFALYCQHQDPVDLENDFDNRPIDYLILLPKLINSEVEDVGATNQLSSKIILDYIDDCFNHIPEHSNALLCVYYRDIEIPNIYNYIIRKKIRWVRGANPYDINSIHRIYTLFSSSKVVYTQEIGSPQPYAGLCGAKVGLSLPFFLADKPGYKFYKRSKWDDFNSIDYARMHYPNLLCENINESVHCLEWAQQETGFNYKMTNEEVSEVVGWQASSILINQIRSLNNRIYVKFPFLIE